MNLSSVLPRPDVFRSPKHLYLGAKGLLLTLSTPSQWNWPIVILSLVVLIFLSWILPMYVWSSLCYQRTDLRKLREELAPVLDKYIETAGGGSKSAIHAEDFWKSGMLPQKGTNGASQRIESHIVHSNISNSEFQAIRRTYIYRLRGNRTWREIAWDVCTVRAIRWLFPAVYLFKNLWSSRMVLQQAIKAFYTPKRTYANMCCDLSSLCSPHSSKSHKHFFDSRSYHHRRLRRLPSFPPDLRTPFPSFHMYCWDSLPFTYTFRTPFLATIPRPLVHFFDSRTTTVSASAPLPPRSPRPVPFFPHVPCMYPASVSSKRDSLDTIPLHFRTPFLATIPRQLVHFFDSRSYHHRLRRLPSFPPRDPLPSTYPIPRYHPRPLVLVYSIRMKAGAVLARPRAGSRRVHDMAIVVPPPGLYTALLSTQPSPATSRAPHLNRLPHPSPMPHAHRPSPTIRPGASTHPRQHSTNAASSAPSTTRWSAAHEIGSFSRLAPPPLTPILPPAPPPRPECGFGDQYWSLTSQTHSALPTTTIATPPPGTSTGIAPVRLPALPTLLTVRVPPVTCPCAPVYPICSLPSALGTRRPSAARCATAPPSS
ncbi:hypothetical protein C8R44DRAFT_987810 [Mycena epipterygia]|nr:hypothetical protein C8R44DRAFT_987810 [Mycena epipterygia]